MQSSSSSDPDGTFKRPAATLAASFIGLSFALEELAAHGAKHRPFTPSALDELRARTVFRMKNIPIDKGLTLQEQAQVITNAIAMVSFQLSTIIDSVREPKG